MQWLSRLVSARPRTVIAVAAFVVFACAVIGGPLPGLLDGGDDFDDPGSPSAHAAALIARATGAEATPGVVAVVPTPTGATSPQARRDVAAVAARLRAVDGIASVGLPAAGDASSTARDGSSVLVTATLSSDASEADVATDAQAALAGTPAILGGGVVAGEQVGAQVQSDLARAELLVMPLLFVLAFLIFRSPVAALVPVVVGASTVMVTFFALLVVDAAAMSVSVFALNLVTGLGLGLAVDYSLLMVSRFREELAGGLAPRAAAVATVRTAGRTVVFSALTVSTALASLLVFPQNFLRSMGVAGIVVPLAAALVTLTLVPATLALLGRRIDAFTPRRWVRREPTSAALPRTGWYRLSHRVLGRPVVVAVVVGAALIALGSPFLGVRFTAVDASMLPTDHSARQAQDVMERTYPGDASAPVLVAVNAGPGAAAQVKAYRQDVARVAAGSLVSPAREVAEGVWRIDVVPPGSQLDQGTKDLVQNLRAIESPLQAEVGGQTARFLDQQDVLAQRIPWALALLVGTTFIILFVMTRSVVLPIKAVLLNGLTIAATFGLLVLIFQDGHLEGLLGFTSQGALEATQPVLLFAIAFALSTDYGTFLLARILEARRAGASDREAVSIGLARTGRIVTAAALLMVAAIGAFATSEIVFIKLVGVGTALSVLIDATVIRAFLVPALMGLLGRANWWAPSWLGGPRRAARAGRESTV